MSHGVFQLENGPYINYKGDPALPPTVLKDSTYTDENKRILIEEMKIPEAALPAVNRLLGRFLHAIEKTSMIPALSLDAVFPEREDEYVETLYGGEELPVYELGYFTTLSPDKLVEAMRDALETLLPEFFRLRGEQITKRQSKLRTVDQPTNPFQATNFLSENMRRILTDRLPSTFPHHELNNMLAVFANSIMARSALSGHSTYGDTIYWRQQRGFRLDGKVERRVRFEEYSRQLPVKIIPPIEIKGMDHFGRYSTLNPADLIKNVRGQFWAFLAGIAMRTHMRRERAAG